jgi:hypothetical protein
MLTNIKNLHIKIHSFASGVFSKAILDNIIPAFLL